MKIRSSPCGFDDVVLPCHKIDIIGGEIASEGEDPLPVPPHARPHHTPSLAVFVFV